MPEEVRNDLQFILVETVEDVIRETIGIDLPKQVVVDMTLENNSFKEPSK